MPICHALIRRVAASGIGSFGEYHRRAPYRAVCRINAPINAPARHVSARRAFSRREAIIKIMSANNGVGAWRDSNGRGGGAARVRRASSF